MTLSVSMITSCEVKQEQAITTDILPSRQLDSTAIYFDQQYAIYTLEGCEYVVVSPGNTNFTWGSHKGNCKNPIHKDTQNGSN